MDNKVKSFNEYIKEANNKVSYRYEISDNLKKVTRIQKSLIDVGQLITEMSDELLALKTNYSSSIEPDRLAILDNMQNNLKVLSDTLSNDDNGMINTSNKLQRNLEKLKKSYLSPTK